jgi:hypothetical protein
MLQKIINNNYIQIYIFHKHSTRNNSNQIKLKNKVILPLHRTRKQTQKPNNKLLKRRNQKLIII